jgi:hypothetical protein
MIEMSLPILADTLMVITLSIITWWSSTTPKPKHKLGTIDWSPEWNYQPDVSKLTNHPENN